LSEFLTPEEVRAFVRRDKARGRRLLARLEAMGVDRVVDSSRPLKGLGAFEALLERCQAVRFDDPEEMLKLASCAFFAVQDLSEKLYGAERVMDYRCRAMVELGNAYRVADRLREAEQALGQAGRYFLQGTRDELLEARLFTIQASLYADCRRFGSAREALDTVQAIHGRRGDSHLAGRTLIKKGLYASYDYCPEEAIVLLSEGLDLVDREREPGLVYIAVHNLARAMTVCGQHREARTVLFAIRGREEDAGGRVNFLKVRWLEAQIAAGLDELDRAELGFKFVRIGFQEQELPYKSALAALELAEVHFRRGRKEETRAVALEAIDTFIELRIPRESLVSVLLLQRSLELGIEEMGSLLRTVIEFLKRAEMDADLRFEDWLETDAPFPAV
jgi:hypothetical protein